MSSQVKANPKHSKSVPKATKTKKTKRRENHRTRKIKLAVVEQENVYIKTQRLLREVYDTEVEIITDKTPSSVLSDNIAKGTNECHSVVDLGAVLRQLSLWNRCLPRVHPYYAVKAFPNTNVIRVLHLQGVKFDCASATEIRTCLGIGAHPNDIIYANPAKGFSHIQYAKEKNVKKMTFDNKEELKKIQKIFPDAELVLRIAANDSQSLMPFGYKFGSSFAYARELIEECKNIGMKLIGISFHVGSGCYNPQAYVDTLKNASILFEYAESIGIPMRFLDLGGGWPGDEKGVELFEKIAKEINPALEQLFKSDIEIIAEPGRFFCMSTTTMAVQIHSKRDYYAACQKVVREDGTVDLVPAEKETQYYVTEGAYGCFNNIVWDFQTPIPKPFKNIPEGTPIQTTTIFGPTCDSLDVIAKKIQFPDMEIGDWLYFSEMGAYTLAAASHFNGFEGPSVCYKIFI